MTAKSIWINRFSDYKYTPSLNSSIIQRTELKFRNKQISLLALSRCLGKIISMEKINYYTSS